VSVRVPGRHPSSIFRGWRALCGTAALAALYGCADALRPEPQPAPEVTPERVGAPFTQPSLYARNVWDMQLFGGLIWLGHGDSIDNWGPIPLWSLDPATGALNQAYTVDDEQVDVFRVLGGQLYVPGHDPRSPDWSLGEFYRLEAGGWVEHRTIPHGLHTFDVALYGGRLFAALGGEETPAEKTVLASGDGGQTWTPVTDEVQRVYSLFELNGVLYGAGLMRDASEPAANRSLLQFDGTRFVHTGIDGTRLLPGVPSDSFGRMVRPTPFHGQLVYVAARNTFDWVPAALAVTRDVREVRRVTLPDTDALPYDLLVRGDTLYLLTSTAGAANGGYTVRVYATTDTDGWRELFHFTAPTFARSFEESGGDFFFGLGCTYSAPHPASGEILRVRWANYAASRFEALR
jgi:hypothetical protein